MGLGEHDEVTAAAIARLAGVSRAAVANWRKRYPEFPKPVGGSEHSPTFSLTEVEEWLKATGKGDQLATAGQTETGTQRVDSPVQLPGDSPYTWARDSLDRLPESGPERGVADLTSGELLARVMASLLPHSTASAVPSGGWGADVPVVLDPACSEATLLLAVADRFGTEVRLAGQEIQLTATEAAVQRLSDNPLGTLYEIHTGDSLLENQLSGYLGTAAAVVCEPPFELPQWPSAELATDPRWEFGTPAPRDGELAWVQHCYAHLRPRGVAVVAVTPRTCLQPSGQQIRAALVRSGVLRDVIALPKGMGSAPDTDVYLWVLQRPYGAPDHGEVRMVDLSRLGAAADVPYEFAAWERLFGDADPTVSRAVPRLELLDGETNLLPSRYVTTWAEASTDDFAHVTDRLHTLYLQAVQGLPRFAAPTKPTHHSHVTLGELERAGVLTVRARDDTPRAGDVLLRTLGRPPIVATGTAADDTGIAQIVEIDPARLDAHFLATFLRADSGVLPAANTLGALNRDDLRRCRVPRLPLAEQQRYGYAFRHLQELQEVLAALERASTHVIEQTVYGLITGVLAPEFALMKNTDDTSAADEEKREL
jgi:type I restriction-modification system DNA methylase subunit